MKVTKSETADADRKRRLAEVFDDALPEGAQDERPEGWGERESGGGGAGDDEWLRGEVPPHHE